MSELWINFDQLVMQNLQQTRQPHYEFLDHFILNKQLKEEILAAFHDAAVGVDKDVGQN